MLENLKEPFAGAEIVKLPLLSVRVEVFVPITVTVVPEIGEPFSCEVTFPLT